MNQYDALYQGFLTRLIQARKDSGLTQVEVAKLIGKPQSFVTKCERGYRRVTMFDLFLFANVYKKKLCYFLDIA